MTTDFNGFLYRESARGQAAKLVNTWVELVKCQTN